MIVHNQLYKTIHAVRNKRPTVNVYCLSPNVQTAFYHYQHVKSRTDEQVSVVDTADQLGAGENICRHVALLHS